MTSNLLFPGVLAAIVVVCAPSAFAQQEGDEIIRSEAVEAGDLDLPADARILHRRLKMAAFRACYQNRLYFENLNGRARLTERRCRRQTLDRAVAALDDDAVLALHLQTTTPAPSQRVDISPLPGAQHFGPPASCRPERRLPAGLFKSVNR